MAAVKNMNSKRPGVSKSELFLLVLVFHRCFIDLYRVQKYCFLVQLQQTLYKSECTIQTTLHSRTS